MTTNDELHQMIERMLERRSNLVNDNPIVLWELLSAELVSIIGHGGFDTLYARTIHLLRAQYPWIEEGIDTRFEKLKAGFDAQAPTAAKAANTDLLSTFTAALTKLIGEPLTTTILCSAWNQENAEIAAKEINNEQ